MADRTGWGLTATGAGALPAPAATPPEDPRAGTDGDCGVAVVGAGAVAGGLAEVGGGVVGFGGGVVGVGAGVVGVGAEALVPAVGAAGVRRGVAAEDPAGAELAGPRVTEPVWAGAETAA